MTLIEDYGLESPTKTLLLLILSIEDYSHTKKMDKLHIQKIIKFFEELCQSKKIDFSNFKLGGVSYKLEENKQELIEYGFIELTSGYYNLTNEGDKAANLLKQTFDEEKYEKLVYAKQSLNDLPSDELMYFMYKTIPTTQEHSTEFKRLERKNEKLVSVLFSKRKIDVATASRWLGISKNEFIKKIPKKTLSVETQKALIEGYQQGADEDLSIAKEFEWVDYELDQQCNM
ncbi:MAG: hypothetical protein FWH37_00550 [Candidatus Bathyarchaeota archaeon]|nr:hypothetical protein [Candidatus Termiticorpusculum sp.]